MRSFRIAAAGALMALGGHSAAIADLAFEPLGFVSGDTASRAWAVSYDGSVVVGTSGLGAAIWSAGNPKRIGPTDVQAEARGVSADGSIVVGNSFPSGRSRAFRWENGTTTSLTPLGTGDFSSARDISADGAVIVGVANTFRFGFIVGVRWTNSMSEDLGIGGRGPTATSADGSVIVGGEGPFTWTDESGVVPIPGTSTIGYATDVSADGSIIVGFFGGINSVPFVHENGVTTLLPGGFASVAGVSDDGSVIVGATARGERPMLWDADRDAVFLSDLLAPVLPNGWGLLTVRAVSGDGKWVVGAARDPQGREQAYRALIPAPAAVAIAIPASLFAARRRR